MPSHTQVQLARGTTAQNAAYTGPQGEPTIDTDDFSLIIHDGATAGGAARLTPLVHAPQGRLTLTSGQPVMTSDVSAGTTIYYTPYAGRWCPIFNGALWQSVPFTETSLALDSNAGHSGYQQNGKPFDLFAFLDAGVFTIGTGPAWTNNSARSAGLTQLNGLWVNIGSATIRFGSASGNTVSVAANQATYLGAMFATADGQTRTPRSVAPPQFWGCGTPITGCAPLRVAPTVRLVGTTRPPPGSKPTPAAQTRRAGSTGCSNPTSRRSTPPASSPRARPALSAPASAARHRDCCSPPWPARRRAA
jgi:hypothetical protein